MQVGSVTKVTPKNGYVEVEFTVDKNVKIPADAKAVTLQTSILADRSVELTPVYRGGPAMKDHDTIGLPGPRRRWSSPGPSTWWTASPYRCRGRQGQRSGAHADRLRLRRSPTATASGSSPPSANCPRPSG